MEKGITVMSKAEAAAKKMLSQKITETDGFVMRTEFRSLTNGAWKWVHGRRGFYRIVVKPLGKQAVADRNAIVLWRGSEGDSAASDKARWYCTHLSVEEFMAR